MSDSLNESEFGKCMCNDTQLCEKCKKYLKETNLYCTKCGNRLLVNQPQKTNIHISGYICPECNNIYTELDEEIVKKRIKDHFKNITKDEFDQNIKKSGYDIYKDSPATIFTKTKK
ncbi:MAG: hypothetical protein ACOC33_00630 [bacterium]